MQACPDFPRLAHDLADPSAWLSRIGADGAAAQLAAAALWCVGLWVAIGVLAGCAAALPGAAGRCADRLARRTLPAALYRIVAGAAGLGVVLAPAAAATAAAAAPYPATPAPAWPSDRALPAPAWPTTPAASPARPSEHSPTHRARPPRPDPGPPPATVVVGPGETLWSIAAEHLPRNSGARRVARAWPRWYDTNRPVIGANPDLIRPGQVLHVPSKESS